MFALAAEKSTLRILVVDDEPLIRWSVCEVLKESGHAVTEADDGASAVKHVASEGRFDVIVLDYRLPDSDDLKLLETLRGLSPATTVIMMTAFGTPEMIAGALNLGAFRVVPKPFDVLDIVKLVADAPSSNRGM